MPVHDAGQQGTCPCESRSHRMRGIFYLFGLTVVALIVLQASIPP